MRITCVVPNVTSCQLALGIMRKVCTRRHRQMSLCHVNKTNVKKTKRGVVRWEGCFRGRIFLIRGVQVFISRGILFEKLIEIGRYLQYILVSLTGHNSIKIESESNSEVHRDLMFFLMPYSPQPTFLLFLLSYYSYYSNSLLSYFLNELE